MDYRKLLVSLLYAAVLLAAPCIVPPLLYAAATITVINTDGPNEGFNAPTPVSPVGGNSGTTLGQQRLIAFQRAANLWGQALNSNVEIRVRAAFNPLGSGILGSTGAISVFRDFPGAPVGRTWYVAALANALAGMDLDGGTADDISAQFSSTFSFYLGLDGHPPAGTFDLVSVVLHELAHGLGFATLVNLTLGTKLMGFNDAYMLWLENHGATPPLYPDMTNAQRIAASTAGPNLHWVGPQVIAASGVLTAGKNPNGHVEIFAPNPQQPGSSVSHFSNTLSPDELMEPAIGSGVARQNLTLTTELFKDTGWSVSVSTVLAAAVVPLSRSVAVGTPATFFAVVGNGGTASATDVGISVKTPLTATFTFWPIDLAANPPIFGAQSTPVTIPPGGSQYFFLALWPTVVIPSTEVQFLFQGTNTAAAPIISGVNTLQLSASVSAPPDVFVSVATCPSDDGVPLTVNLPGPTGVTGFVAPMLNIGATGQVTVSVNTAPTPGTPSLPVKFFLCETNAVGTCVNPPGGYSTGSVTTTINSGQQTSFNILAQGIGGSIAFNPAVNRVFLIVTEGSTTSGPIRGLGSAGIRTHSPTCAP